MATLPAVAEPLGTQEPLAAVSRAPGGPGRGRRFLTVALFMGPAAVLLGFIVAYPTVATVVRSFYDRSGDNFVGSDNYRTLFGTTSTLVAIRNNAIWIIVFPF